MRKLRSCSGSLVKDMENVISGNVVTCQRHGKLISFWLLSLFFFFTGWVTLFCLFIRTSFESGKKIRLSKSDVKNYKILINKYHNNFIYFRSRFTHIDTSSGYIFNFLLPSACKNNCWIAQFSFAAEKSQKTCPCFYPKSSF